MDELLKVYNSRIKRLSSLLREYEEYLADWDGARLNIPERRRKDNPHIIESYIEIEFYKRTIRKDANNQVRVYRRNTIREFDFTIEELDKAIDRYRKKIEYEKNKQSTD